MGSERAGDFSSSSRNNTSTSTIEGIREYHDMFQIRRFAREEGSFEPFIGRSLRLCSGNLLRMLLVLVQEFVGLNPAVVRF